MERPLSTDEGGFAWPLARPLRRRMVEGKMKKLFAAALILAGTIVQSPAADLGRGYGQPYAAPPPPMIYRWMGPYLGANLGYQFGSASNNPTEPSGIMGGLQAGYNWQNGNLVFGVETDINLSGADDVFAPWKFSNPWFGTLRGRVGFAANNVLFYGTGGLAYGGLELQQNLLSESKTHIGWTAGAGVEFGLTQQWSAKLEYLYLSYADRNYSVAGGTSVGLDTNLVRFGVNYRF
jgi:outer membrane immunogenic protein